MQLTFSNLLFVIVALALIVLASFAYVRSRQGDQRMIETTNQMLLPILSIIVITVTILHNNTPGPTCTGTLNSVKYIGFIASLLLIVIGVIRFILSRSRDRRLITHPVLFAVIILSATFLVEQLYGCI
jgi:cytochrome bd-type quinol oxidase subunit 2